MNKDNEKSRLYLINRIRFEYQRQQLSNLSLLYEDICNLTVFVLVVHDVIIVSRKRIRIK